MRQEGGLAAINSLIDTLSSIAGTDREMIAQCTAVLDEEEEADTLIKNQYGVRWTRTPSRTLTQVFPRFLWCSVVERRCLGVES